MRGALKWNEHDWLPSSCPTRLTVQSGARAALRTCARKAMRPCPGARRSSPAVVMAAGCGSQMATSRSTLSQEPAPPP